MRECQRLKLMDVRTIETRIHRTSFGIQCLDNVTQQVVRTGLSLSLRPVGAPLFKGIPVAAFLTPSGTYAFEGVAGLRAWETDTSVAFPAAQSFLLLCEDAQGNYLGCSQSLGQTNLQKPSVLPLFSTPSRRPIPGMTVVRGHVEQVQGANRVPAPYARIDAQYAPPTPAPVPPTPIPTYTGLSDSRGEFALLLPVPDPGSKPSNPTAALPDQMWPITLTFSYTPASQQYACIDPQNHVEILVGPTQSDLAKR